MIVVSIICFDALGSYAQFKFEKPVLITKEQGIPVGELRTMRKGKDGFMWIGSASGLCRFDGQQVRMFQEGKDLHYSLFENMINSVLPVDNEVWVATTQGVSVLNTTDYTFRHYQFNDTGKTVGPLQRKHDQTANTLYTDRNGNIWIGTAYKGLFLYDRATDNFKNFRADNKKYPPLNPSLGPNYGILSIEASRNNDSIIWAGTPGGLLEVNKFSNDVRLFTFTRPGKDYQVALNAFRRMCYMDDGLLYVGSWGAGVNVFDPTNKTFTPLILKTEEEKKAMGGVIGNLFRKTDHEIWITAGNGLVIYDIKLKKVTWYKSSDLTENLFYSIDYIDEANRVWHSGMKGLEYFDPSVQQFSTFSFKPYNPATWGYAFYILSDKTGDIITVCPRQTDGIYHFNRNSSQWTKSTFPNNKKFLTEKDVVRGLVQLPSGDYIFSSYRGVFLFSEKKNKLTELSAHLPLGSTRWGEILLDRNSNLWISADAFGLIRMNPYTYEYRLYGKELFEKSFDSTFIKLVNFFEDSRGNIWFERPQGICVYVPAKDSIVSFLYSKNEKNSFPFAGAFTEDKKGRVWVNGSDYWLGYALSDDPLKGIVYKTNMREHGVTDAIFDLVTDKSGQLWTYSNNELLKINPDNLTVKKFSFQYGVEEPDFYHFSFLPSGEMVFGGRNDITIANPFELKRNTELPVPYIDQISVLNQPVNTGINAQPLRFKHNQNFFSIGFSAQAYTMAKEVRFRYRLKDFDDWTEVTGRRFANYTNVPGGDYVFQLQAANNEGLWNKKILELPIHVGTAYWRTWWFRISLLVLTGLAASWFYKFRLDQARKKQKLKSEYEKKLANVEMSALLAQMNPHFLFNSLNSIDSYIIRNESKKASEYLNNFARLMRLILQNSRSNYISLKDELEALDLYLQMESLRFKNKFNYSIQVSETIDTSSIVLPPMLIQPYVENAIWHGLMHKSNGEEGKVELQLSKQQDALLCVIVDNGIGRKKAAELKAQRHTNHKRSMGMQITEDRIEIINKLYNINTTVKIYDVENTSGESKGTRVELTIPV